MITWVIVWFAAMWIGLGQVVVGRWRRWPALERVGGIVIVTGFVGVLLMAAFWLARKGG